MHVLRKAATHCNIRELCAIFKKKHTILFLFYNTHILQMRDDQNSHFGKTLTQKRSFFTIVFETADSQALIAVRLHIVAWEFPLTDVL